MVLTVQKFAAALVVFAATLAFYPGRAFAGVEQLSEAEFRALAAEIAPKVNLFRHAWEQDPTAEFYGGTSRDYLYWLKGKFRDASDRAAAEKVRAELRARSVIDVREFIIGDSDIDILSDSVRVSAADFGIKKIDVSNNALRKNTAEVLAEEVKQGYIPAEKVRLSKEGFSQPKELGDGLGEIYRGQLSVKFPDPKEFAETRYARAGLNHPILLALRFLRLQAMNYFQTHGAGAPDEKVLLAIDAATQNQIRAISREVADGKALKPYLEQPKFREWLNGTIQKAFRSYTNPTAAHRLLQEFGLDSLPLAYGKSVEPINQYLFAKARDPAKISAAFDQYGVSPEEIFRPVKSFFPDGLLYHGTRSEEAFRNVVFQGVLESSGGTAGKGLYGVATKDREFAEGWGGDKNRLLSFPVREDAKIIDVTSGPGKQLWRAYQKAQAADYEGFADTFGADIVKYPYDRDAYVVKNSASLGRARGVYREILPLEELFDALARRPADFFALVEINRLNAPELSHAADLAGLTKDRLIAELSAGRNLQTVSAVLSVRPSWEKDAAVHQAMLANGALDREFTRLLVNGQAEWKPAWVQAVLKRGLADDLLVKSPKIFRLPDSHRVVQTLLGRISRCRLMLGLTDGCKDWENRAADLLQNLAQADGDKKYREEVDSLVKLLGRKHNDWIIVRGLLDTPYREEAFRLAAANGPVAARVRENLRQQAISYKNEALALEYLQRIPPSAEDIHFISNSVVPAEAARGRLWEVLQRVSDEELTKLARLLFQRNWGPDAVPLVEELLRRMKYFPEGFADQIFENPKWTHEQKRAWIQKMVDEGRNEISLLIDVLPKEPWVRETAWFDTILQRGRADRFFRTFALNSQPSARPDWFRTLLERGRLDNNMVLVLENPKWADHPELLYPYFESAYLSKDRRTFLKRVLKASHWQNHPTLLELTGGRPPTVENMRLALHGKGAAALWSGLRNDCASFFARVKNSKFLR